MTVSGGPRNVDDLSGGLSGWNHIVEHRAVGVLHQGLEFRELRSRHAGQGRQRHEIFAVAAGNVRTDIVVRRRGEHLQTFLCPRGILGASRTWCRT